LRGRGCSNHRLVELGCLPGRLGRWSVFGDGDLRSRFRHVDVCESFFVCFFGNALLALAALLLVREEKATRIDAAASEWAIGGGTSATLHVEVAEGVLVFFIGGAGFLVELAEHFATAAVVVVSINSW
jgi:hypothetical protein